MTCRFALLALLALPPAALSFGDSAKPCTASQRYVLVTVLEHTTERLSGDTLAADPEMSGSWPDGKLTLLDRCADGGLSAFALPSGKSFMTSMVMSIDGQILVNRRWIIKESLVDICRAVSDCADATAVR